MHAASKSTSVNRIVNAGVECRSLPVHEKQLFIRQRVLIYLVNG